MRTMQGQEPRLLTPTHTHTHARTPAQAHPCKASPWTTFPHGVNAVTNREQVLLGS